MIDRVWKVLGFKAEKTEPARGCSCIQGTRVELNPGLSGPNLHDPSRPGLDDTGCIPKGILLWRAVKHEVVVVAM
jgi:hypothetical protein